MATITGLTMTITRTYTATGDSCTVNYSYSLICDAKEEALGAGLSFTVSFELWGKDGGWFNPDDPRGTPPYDTHTVNCGDTMPISRSFTLASCGTLDEDIGEDEIYLKLKVTPSVGLPGVPGIPTYTADRAVVKGSF